MRIFCPAIVCSLSFRVLPTWAPQGHRTHGGACAPWHFLHCSAVRCCTAVLMSTRMPRHPAPSHPGTRGRKRPHLSEVSDFGSAARGLDGDAFASSMHCPGSDPAHAKRGAGMWNLTSLRVTRACRKLGRVADSAARDIPRMTATNQDRLYHAGH